MNNLIGNGSTVIKIISMAIAGWFVGILVSNGLDLGIDASQLSEVIFFIIGIILAYIDAKYPNTFEFLGNTKPSVNCEETVLNDEYELIGGNDDC